MANDFVKVPADSADATGKKLDTTALTVGANVVHRNRTVIADDNDTVGVARVTNTTPATTDYALATRPVGNVPIITNSIVSSLNSSSIALAAGATFTGISENVLSYSTISIQVFANQVSANNGFSIQWSGDGINWDGGDSFTIPTLNGKHFTFGVVAQFFRIVYVNGATAQTIFRLYVILHPVPIKNSSSRLSDIVTPENDSELVKAIMAARISGNFDIPDMTLINGLNSLNFQQQILTKPTYRAVANRISFALVANTPKQYIDLWHANTVLKTVKLRRVLVTISSSSVASIITIDITRISAVPTGGTTVVMGTPDSSDVTSTTTSVTLPTTDATLSGGLIAAQSYNLGIIGGTTDATKLVPIILYDYQESGDQKPLTIKSGVTEGFAIRFTGNVATTLFASITLEFTEE